MATIILSYDETSFGLKQDCARYVKIPEIKVHFEAMRIKDMVIIKNLEKAPLYIYQEDFVDCYLDEVLAKATVHAHAKIYYDCKKVDGVWKKNEDSFIYVLYPTSPPNSPKYSPIKRKYIAQVEEEEMDRRVNQAIRN
jgi:hypothetical protein